MSMPMNKTQVRGRPVDLEKQIQQKSKLLKAALQLLSSKAYKSITIREIANLADVNSAMVSYYFDNKEGLFIALLDEVSKQHFEEMKKIKRSDQPLKTFIETMIKKLNKESGLARMIHGEILNHNSELGNAFIERFPKRMSIFLPQLVMSNTQITDPVKAKYAAFTLVSMIITPFIGAPVRVQGWGISDEELAKPEWAEHIYTTFISGCGVLTNNKQVGLEKK
jgi:AcrR family transcriptional regulator